MEHKERNRQTFIVIAILALLLVGGLIIALDWRNARQLVGEASWKMVLLSMLCVAGSYICLSYSFMAVNRIFDINMKRRDLLEIGFISSTLNNLLAFLGAAGHSLRLMIMQRKGVKPEKALAASIFHSHFHNLMMFALLPIGIIYLILHHSVSQKTEIVLVLTTVLLILLVVLATAIVFSRSLRLKVLNLLNRLSRLIIRKNIESSAKTFDDSMNIGVVIIKAKPVLMIPVFVLIIADWATALAALWFCFYALGNFLSLGVLITGFAVGITVGNISLIPGGLGMQEASMAGVYALLGVPFELAVLASILFRVVYDFIPFLISVFFYRRLLKTVDSSDIGN